MTVVSIKINPTFKCLSQLTLADKISCVHALITSTSVNARPHCKICFTSVNIKERKNFLVAFIFVQGVSFIYHSLSALISIVQFFS